jgi:hypothetical protein
MRFMKLLVATLAVCSAICMAPQTLTAQQAMNNDAVIKLVKAGLSEDLIISTINSQPGTYDTSTDGLIALKKAGVSDKVVGAIVTKGFAPAPAPVAASGRPQGIDEIGVYLKDKNGAWVAMLPEIVNFKTGGFLKTLATDGIVKGDVNGRIVGVKAKQSATLPASFAVYLPEGVEISEYQLLRLRPNSDSREFRSVTGGVAHTSGGATRDAVEFQAEKLAPRVYQITIQTSLGKGEYGLLPPGAVGSSNLGSNGKIYTVSITE